MTAPVVISENDLAAILSVAAGNPCRDERQQVAMLDAAAHVDPLFVDFVAWVQDSWEATPCPSCDRPVGRHSLDVLCGECREDDTLRRHAYEARRP